MVRRCSRLDKGTGEKLKIEELRKVLKKIQAQESFQALSFEKAKNVQTFLKHGDALLDVADIAKEFNKRTEAPCLTWDGWLALSDALKKLEEL